MVNGTRTLRRHRSHRARVRWRSPHAARRVRTPSRTCAAQPRSSGRAAGRARRDTSGAVTNSRYASSNTTSSRAAPGRGSAPAAARPTVVPVGLFGLHTNTTRVRSVIASAMASRSWRWSTSGTCTIAAPSLLGEHRVRLERRPGEQHFVAGIAGGGHGHAAQLHRPVGRAGPGRAPPSSGRPGIPKRGRAVVGIAVGAAGRGFDRLQGRRQRSERGLVRRQLDHVADGVLRRHRLRRPAGHVLRQARPAPDECESSGDARVARAALRRRPSCCMRDGGALHRLAPYGLPFPTVRSAVAYHCQPWESR